MAVAHRVHLYRAVIAFMIAVRSSIALHDSCNICTIDILPPSPYTWRFICNVQVLHRPLPTCKLTRFQLHLTDTAKFLKPYIMLHFANVFAFVSRPNYSLPAALLMNCTIRKTFRRLVSAVNDNS